MSAGRAWWRGLIEAYRDRLPVTEATPVVTLYEGNTPLVPAPLLSERTECDVYLKVEGANPTGSFKDRGMTVAVSKAVEAGAKAIICASTGNTSASAAAYAARAGITCAVLIPAGKIATGKLAQALVHGARPLQVAGNFDDCLSLASKLAVDYPVALVNSVNPDRLEGQKTAAFEIVEALGDVRLLDVQVGAGDLALHLAGGTAADDADCGRPAARPRGVQHLDTGRVGQVQVQDHQVVRRLAPQRRQRLRDGADPSHGVAPLAEQDAEHGGEGRRVVHQQDA